MKDYIRLRNYTQKDVADLICHGCVRKKSVLHIPFEIITIIISFYFEEFKFNQDEYGDNLEFLSDTIVKKPYPPNGEWNSWKWSTCSFGATITNKMCSMFEITYELIDINDHDVETPDIHLGFARSLDIIEWNKASNWEYDENDEDVFFIWISYDYCWNGLGYYDRTEKREFCLCSDDEDFYFGRGSTLTLQYDFITGDITIYHNNKTEYCGKVKVKKMDQIIPVVSIACGGKVQIVDWNFYQKKT